MKSKTDAAVIFFDFFSVLALQRIYFHNCSSKYICMFMYVLIYSLWIWNPILLPEY